jgi:hypothetical protein
VTAEKASLQEGLSWDFSTSEQLPAHVSKMNSSETKGEYMKSKMIAIACVAMASLVSVQTNMAQTGSGGPTSTGTTAVAPAPSGVLSVNEFEPGKSIKVTSSGAGTQAVVYKLAPNARYVSETGGLIDPSDIQPGTRVRLNVTGTGPGLTVDRVVVIAPK